MSESPRRQSKLAAAPFGVPEVEPPAAPPPVSRPRPDTNPPAPVTRNPRRRQVVGRVSGDDLVSQNCKMTRTLRVSLKAAAAGWECDIQDVVNAALIEYLQARGIDPTTQSGD